MGLPVLSLLWGPSSSASILSVGGYNDIARYQMTCIETYYHDKMDGITSLIAGASAESCKDKEEVTTCVRNLVSCERYWKEGVLAY